MAEKKKSVLPGGYERGPGDAGVGPKGSETGHMRERAKKHYMDVEHRKSSRATKPRQAARKSSRASGRNSIKFR